MPAMAVSVSSFTASSNLCFHLPIAKTSQQGNCNGHLKLVSSDSRPSTSSSNWRSSALVDGTFRNKLNSHTKIKIKLAIEKSAGYWIRAIVNKGSLESEKEGWEGAETGPVLSRKPFTRDWQDSGFKKGGVSEENLVTNGLTREQVADGEVGTDAEFLGSDGEGEVEEEHSQNDYWDRNVTGVGAETSIATTANQWVEDDLNKRIRFQNGREVFEERAYLIGIERKGAGQRSAFGIQESLEELSQLADTAGLAVVGTTYQKLEYPSPKTYIGAGKLAEVATAVKALKVETVIFDDELSPGQLRNLEKSFEDNVRVCDRTALILDIFNQRAATREATLQVDLAQFEYQLPRLTRMWTHLERQAGGLVKGMGEKQIEIDKRILRTQIAQLKRELESVRGHRQQYRDRRASVPIPVVSLVGYTNAGKSTLLNRLSGAGVLAEDRLFATLDPTTRRVELPNGKECLFTDTVGFIQKLPTQLDKALFKVFAKKTPKFWPLLVAAFRATLEEISDSSLLLHVVDISHPMAAQQREAVNKVLAELDVDHIPYLCVWNKLDRAEDPEAIRIEAAHRGNVACISALTGEGMDEFYEAVERKIKELMVWVEAVVPYGQGELVNLIHRLGIVEVEEYTDKGTLIRAHVPTALSKQLLPLRRQPT